MTREEAISNLKQSKKYCVCACDEALDMAIKALESIDKIKSEIADLDDAEYEFEGYYKAVNDALKIIEKYIGDTE